MGVTPLHSAAEKNAVDVAELLLQHGADAQSSNAVGDTPLHWAAEKGHTRLAELLLGAGADAQRPNKYGSTPLHAAVSGGHGTLAAALVAAGADASARDAHGKSPLELCRSEEMRAVLMRHASHALAPPSTPASASASAAGSVPPSPARASALAAELEAAAAAAAASVAAERRRAPAWAWEAQPVPRESPQPAAAPAPPALPSPAAVAPAPLPCGEDALTARVLGAAAAAAARAEALRALRPALDTAAEGLSLFQTSARLAAQLRLLRTASALEADAAATQRTAQALHAAAQRCDDSRLALAQLRGAVRAQVTAGAAEQAVARAASERDRAQAQHKANVGRAQALAAQLAAAQASREGVTRGLVEGAEHEREDAAVQGDDEADVGAAAAAARAAVESAALQLVPASERSAAAAEALLAALAQEAETAAALSAAVEAALRGAVRASAAAARGVQRETPGADSSAALRLSAGFERELRGLGALEETRAGAAAAALQLCGVCEARLDAQLASEELGCEARKAALRGGWPPGRQAAHGAAESQCAAMLRAYDDDAARLRAALAGAPLARAYPELAAQAQTPPGTGLAVGVGAPQLLSRAALEERETLRRTEAAALLRVAPRWQAGCQLSLKVLPGRGGAAWERAAARLTPLRSPRLLPLLAAFTDQQGAACLLSPLTPSGSVRARAEAQAAAAAAGGADSWALWRRVARQALQALACLHAAGVAHGALSWDNLLWEGAEGGDVLLAHAGCASQHHRLEGGEQLTAAAEADVAALGALLLTLAPPPESPLAQLGAACVAVPPAARPTAAEALLHCACSGAQAASGTPLAAALGALGDAAATTRARGGAMPLAVSAHSALLREVLVAHDDSSEEALGRPWAASLEGRAVPPAQLLAGFFAQVTEPGCALLDGAVAGAGEREGEGEGDAAPCFLPCRDDAPDAPCLHACGLSRARALRALGRVMARAAVAGVSAAPLRWHPLGYASLCADGAGESLGGDVHAALAALQRWDAPRATELAQALARRAEAQQQPSWAGEPLTDANKRAVIAAVAADALLGCRREGMRALAQGFREALAALQGPERLSAALAALPAPQLAVALSSGEPVPPAPLADALLWAECWPAEAPAKEQLRAWLHAAADVPRALFAQHGQLLVVPSPDSSARFHGGEASLALPQDATDAARLGDCLMAALLAA